MKNTRQFAKYGASMASSDEYLIHNIEHTFKVTCTWLHFREQTPIVLDSCTIDRMRSDVCQNLNEASKNSNCKFFTTWGVLS